MAFPVARVGVFSGSSPIPAERYARGRQVLVELGLTPIESPGLWRSHGYLAGTDDERLDALHALLDDPSVDALIGARGGYGLHRIADRLDLDRIRRAQKPLLGFSDLTILLSAWAEAGAPAVHAPVVTQLGDLGPDDLAHLRAVLAGRPAGLSVPLLPGPGIARGRAEGPVFAGNLSMLSSLAGTPFFPALDGRVLVLEDVGEATYRVDRMLSQLRLAGVFARIAGLAVGEMVGCGPRSEGEQTMLDVLDAVVPPELPLLYPIAIGHGRHHRALPIGAPVVLDGAAGRLELQ